LGGFYVESFPTSPNVPNVRFNVAKMHYDQAEYDMALELFTEYAKLYPASAESTGAVNLALDSLFVKEQYEDVIKVGGELLAIAGLSSDASQSVQKAIKEAERQIVMSATVIAAGDSGKTGIEVSRQYEGKIAEDVLYNTFVEYKESRRPILMFKAGEEMLGRFPKSVHIKAILTTMGATSISTANFENAAATYETYAERFSSDSEASTSILSAAKIRMLLGDFRAASRDYKLAIKLKAGSEAVDGLLNAYASAEDWESIIGAAKRYKPNSARAFLLEGKAHLENDNSGEAMDSLNRAISSGSDADSAAEAQYLLASFAFEEFESITIDGADPANTAEIIQQKAQALEDTREVYEQTLQMGSAVWSIASLAKIASAYDNFANFLENVQLPTDLSPEENAQFREILNGLRDEKKAVAKDAYKTCLSKAYSLNVFSHYVVQCATKSEVTKTSPRRRKIELGQTGKQLQLAILEKPKEVKNFKELAFLYLQRGDYFQARLILSKALEINPDSEELHNGLGVALWLLEQPQEAYFEFQKALDIKPNYAPAHVNMGALWFEHKNNKSAKAEFLRGKKANRNASNVHPRADAYATELGL
jgi:tetratricopeptide (TPR) repeat protein